MAAATGDDDLLESLYVHRILTSGQLARRTGRSAPVVRRRIRRHMAPAGLVAVHRGGGSTEQQAYSLTKQGFTLMAARAGTDLASAPFSSRPPSGPGSPFFRHTLLTNTIWIEFGLACSRPRSPVKLVRAVPEWMMSGDPQARRAKEPWRRFVICERQQDMADTERFHVVRPDALFLFAPRGSPGLRVATYLEADRATVSVSTVITRKLLGYWHVFIHQSFRRWGAVAMRVCFVVGSTKTEQRIDSIRSALADFCRRNAARHERFCRDLIEATPPERRAVLAARLQPIEAFAGCFRLCRREDFMDTDILTGPAWRDNQGRRVPFFRGRLADNDSAINGAGEAQS